MFKLMSAKTAFALSRSTHTVNKALERVNSAITDHASCGRTKIMIKMPEPIDLVEIVVQELKDAGYDVVRSCCHPEYTLLRISWAVS